jgi:hypothetical protein
MLSLSQRDKRNDFIREPGAIGFRVGDKGTHTSRTMMLTELTAVLAAEAPEATRTDYADAIIAGNCLGKPTVSTRRLTDQRLSELYALDPTVPLFRVLRRLWDLDVDGRPLLALLAAIARDPLLAATAPAVLNLLDDQEVSRSRVTSVLRNVVGDRLNAATLDKVARNAGSSWTQSGHLEGRTFKRRRRVHATSGAVTYALYLSYHAGFRGDELFGTPWIELLDCTPARARELAVEAKRSGMLDIRFAGDVVSVSFDRLEGQ